MTKRPKILAFMLGVAMSCAITMAVSPAWSARATKASVSFHRESCCMTQPADRQDNASLAAPSPIHTDFLSSPRPANGGDTLGYDSMGNGFLMSAVSALLAFGGLMVFIARAQY